MPFFLVPIALLLLYALERYVFEKYWERGLSAELDFEKEAVTEGEMASLKEVITNRNFIPLHILQINFQTDVGLDFTDSSNCSITDRVNVLDVFSLRFYERITRSLMVECKKRGFYSILSTSLVASDFFSPDIHYATRQQKTGLYVYPRELSYEKIRIPFQQMMGEVMSKRFLYEDNFTFRGIRDYAPTDTMSNINWKASAKTGGLKVNLHDHTASPEVMIVLNLDEPGILFETELLEDCIRLSLTFATSFIKENIPVSLLTNGRDKLTGEVIKLEAGASASHIRNFSRALARIDLVGKKSGEITELIENEFSKSRSQQLTYLYISTSRRDSAVAAAKRIADEKGRIMWICPLTRGMEKGGPGDPRIEFCTVLHE